jgi:hypothetical protein
MKFRTSASVATLACERHHRAGPVPVLRDGKPGGRRCTLIYEDPNIDHAVMSTRPAVLPFSMRRCAAAVSARSKHSAICVVTEHLVGQPSSIGEAGDGGIADDEPQHTDIRMLLGCRS